MGRDLIIIFIKTYKIFISSLTGPVCRFHPTCSEYAVEAVKKYGSFKGSLLAVKRILKCHPFHPGGVDPLP